MATNDDLAKELNKRGEHLTRAVTIQRDPSSLYQAWRGFQSLPRLIDQVEQVQELSETRTRWTVRGPGDKTYTWEADIIRDEPDAVIAWKADGDVAHSGSINFRPLPFHRGTEVKVSIEYIPPAGQIGTALAKLFGAGPKEILDRALHRFRQAMEAGELATTAGQPVGAGRAGEERLTDDDVRDIADREGRP